MTCETRCPKCGSYRRLVVRESYDYQADERGKASSHNWENPIRRVHCLACDQDVTESFGVVYDSGMFVIIPKHQEGDAC